MNELFPDGVLPPDTCPCGTKIEEGRFVCDACEEVEIRRLMQRAIALRLRRRRERARARVADGQKPHGTTPRWVR